jgi:ribosome-associated protein
LTRAKGSTGDASGEARALLRAERAEPMKLPAAVKRAAEAALDKKAEDVVVLDLRKGSAFTDFFVLASGTSQRQIVAVADAVQEAMRAEDLRPKHVEGYPRQEWILLDYTGFVVHIFTPRTRSFYDLERLWGGAGRLEVKP